VTSNAGKIIYYKPSQKNGFVSSGGPAGGQPFKSWPPAPINKIILRWLVAIYLE
jgi:hypothetical protein